MDEVVDEVLVEVSTGGVAIVTLHRPERLNAWTRTMSDQLSDAMEQLDRDDDVVVVTGAGRAFCAGVDIGQFTTRDPARQPPRRPWSQRTVPSAITKPVVAAINGPAVGVGLAWAMHCDVRYVAIDAKLGFVFNRRGMPPEVAMHRILPRISGSEVAADILLSGRIFEGGDAVRMGLASAAYPAEDVLPAAIGWASDVVANCSPASVGATKRLLWGRMRADDLTAMEIEDRLAVAFAAAPDAREGMVAFREKRVPTWTTTARDGADAATDAITRAEAAPHAV